MSRDQFIPSIDPCAPTYVGMLLSDFSVCHTSNHDLTASASGDPSLRNENKLKLPIREWSKTVSPVRERAFARGKQQVDFDRWQDLTTRQTLTITTESLFGMNYVGE